MKNTQLGSNSSDSPKKDSSELFGSLQIKAQKGLLYKDTDFIGKMDPYVVIKYQKKLYFTETCKGGGKEPVWTKSFTLDIHSIDDEIQLFCYEKDWIMKDDKIGQATIPVRNLLSI